MDDNYGCSEDAMKTLSAVKETLKIVISLNENITININIFKVLQYEIFKTDGKAFRKSVLFLHKMLFCKKRCS